MRKLKRKFLKMGGRKAICLLAVVGTIVLLTSMAMAVMTEQEITPENCPNHTEHDESCGYVEAVEAQPCSHEHTEECYVDGELNCQHVHNESCGYVEAVEGYPCEHKCPVCDPAELTELDKGAYGFDKNQDSEKYKDIKISLILHSDILEGISHVTEEKGADGEPILSDLIKDEEYTFDEKNGELTIKKEYLEQQKEANHTFKLLLEGGEQEIFLNIENSKEGEQSDDMEQSSQPAEEANRSTMQASAADICKVSLDVPNLNKEDPYLAFNSTSIPNGVVNMSVSLPIGIKGRYIELLYPEYGFDIIEPLPKPDGKILNSAKVNVDGRLGIRIQIADSVDEVLNIQFLYGLGNINLPDDVQKEWGMTGICPFNLAFEAKVYGGDGSLLDEGTSASWTLANKETPGFSANNWKGRYISLVPSESVETTLSFTSDIASAGDVAREDIRRIRIYVPDPEKVETSISGISSSSESNIRNRFDIGELQSDGENWWYDLIAIPEAKIVSNWYDKAGYISINVNVELRRSGAAPSEKFPVPDAELLVRRYGSDDLHTVELNNIIYQMRELIEDDLFYGEYSNLGKGYATAVYSGSTSNKKDIVKSLWNGSGVNTSNLFTEYKSTHRAEPTVESYEFPYGVQPTLISYVSGARFEYMKNMFDSCVYETSDGSTHTASVKMGSVAELLIDFDQIPEGTRVTKATINWKEIYFDSRQSYNGKTGWGNMYSRIIFDTPEKYEDGSFIPANTYFEVQHKLKTPQSTKEMSSQNGGIWVKIEPTECPSLVLNWDDIAEKYYNYLSSMVLARDQVVTGSELKVKDLSSILKWRSSVENPKVKLSVVSGINDNYKAGITDEEYFGYLFTGKFKAMPILSGWTIEYRTRDEGTKLYVLPSSISEEGVEVSLPLLDGDRLLDGIVFRKEGNVSGWNANTILIKDIQYQFCRETDAGKAMTTDSFVNIYIKIGFNADDCPQHSSDYDDYWKYAPHYSDSDRHFMRIYNEINLSLMTSTKSGDTIFKTTDIYQGEEKEWQGRFTLLQSFQDGGAAFYSEWSGLDYGENITPAMYVEVKNPDILYAGKATFYIQSELAPATDVEYIETDSGKVFLKISGGTVAKIRSKDSVWETSISVYALPGAGIGKKVVVGAVYLDIGADKLQSRYDGSKESGYTRLTLYNAQPDIEGLLGDGDTTTPRLFLLNADKEIEILQKIFSGTLIIPGTADGYAIESRNVEFFNHDAENLKALLSINASNEDLRNYESVIEIPKEGKRVTGKSNIGESQTVTSDYTMELTQVPKIINNPTDQTPLMEYRLTGSSGWLPEGSVTDWSQVDAVKIYMDILPKYASLNFELYMRTEQSTEKEARTAYISGSFSFTSVTGLRTEDEMVYGTYSQYGHYTVSGTIWFDNNENGVLDLLEPKGSDITLKLRRSSDDTIIDTQVTDVNGNYEFSVNEGRDLYVEIELAEKQKLTKQTTASDFTFSSYDSDFSRETNRFVLPSLLKNGNYGKLGAGIIRLPELTAPDMEVAIGKSIAGKVKATSDRTNNLLLHYEASEDESIATVKVGEINTNIIASPNSVGGISGITLGSTEAMVWVENSLGDRVESTYKITVVPDVVNFTLGKNLTSASREDETFVFMIEHQDEDGQTDEVFYQTVRIPAGSQSGSIEIKKVKPGNYRITELDSNWRYSAQGGNVKNISMDDSEESYRVDFTNRKDTDAWVSGKTEVTNIMQDTTP